MSDNLGANFNPAEKEFITFPADATSNNSFSTQQQSVEQSSTSLDDFLYDAGDPKKMNPDIQYNEDGTPSSNKKTTASTYSNPLRKIGGGGVLQYPIDLDTDLQDYFEIQIFNYRPARTLPSIKYSSQGYSYDKDGNVIDTNSLGNSKYAGYYSGSNQRGNRQNFRLQDLQSTIQIPIPPSIKDMNAVTFGGERMGGFAAAIAGPIISQFLKGNEISDEDSSTLNKLRTGAQNLLKNIKDGSFGVIGNGIDALNSPDFIRLNTLRTIGQSVARLGVNIDVDQAITRASGAVRNPNFELLFSGPSLRSFSFTIRFTPRDLDESKRVRMIIRALKQHSAVKKNPNILNRNSNESSNFLIGTPDVFKLRYIKARTQKDIKGLNKFKTCALTNVSVDYTGEVGRFAAYEEDSQPVTTILSLSFTELTPIYDDDYAEFTTDDDVGL